jgi:NAD(P)-dependent dehydrogenase (short-subunit alcohol dehydrogenase family)
VSGDFAGRVAVVTGGTGALGQAVSRRLLGAGATVAIPYAVEDEARALRERVAAADRARLVTEPVDVTDLAAMTAFADRAVARGGRLDVLVAAVGGFAGGGLLETDLGTWEAMLRLNLTSAFTAARAVVPHLVDAGRGRVVFVASRAVLPPAGGFLAYTVAKSGVVALAQALAREVAPRGVTVNAVAPSTMDTAANRRAMPGSDRAGWVSVEAVAEAIAFLASEAAGPVNGTVLRI